jgi:hypothetical protein
MKTIIELMDELVSEKNKAWVLFNPHKLINNQDNPTLNNYFNEHNNANIDVKDFVSIDEKIKAYNNNEVCTISFKNKQIILASNFKGVIQSLTQDNNIIQTSELFQTLFCEKYKVGRLNGYKLNGHKWILRAISFQHIEEKFESTSFLNIVEQALPQYFALCEKIELEKSLQLENTTKINKPLKL